MSFGGSSLPWATPRSAPMDSSTICGRSNTSISRPDSLATSRAASAIRVGVMELGGSLAMSRQRLTAPAMTAPRATPFSKAPLLSASSSTMVTPSTSRRSSELDLKLSNR